MRTLLIKKAEDKQQEIITCQRFPQANDFGRKMFLEYGS
jgi:hypothetical protein